MRLGLLCAAISVVGWLVWCASGLLAHFPPKSLGRLPVVGGGPRVTRKVVVIVVDGLALAPAQEMWRLMALARRGVWRVASVELPSYSRVAYAVLGTGATPGITGVTSNRRVDLVPVDSIFRRARKAGLVSGLVGYAWWMELFGGDIPLASVGSAWKPDAPVFRQSQRALQALAKPRLAGAEVRVLRNDAYIGIREPWRTYLWRHRIYDRFGDDPETPLHEDMVRANEAIRWLKRDTLGWMMAQPPVDLLYVHLQAPDQAGHATGSPASEEYLHACEIVDQAIQKIAVAMDLSKDTLIVTADHGFSRAVKGAGHGGWEASVSQVPLVMVGKGIRRGWKFEESLHPARREALQLVRHIDVVPTLAVLLGLPFPSINQGVVIWDALDIPFATRRLRKRHMEIAQLYLYDHLMAQGGGERVDRSALAAGTDQAIEAQWKAAVRGWWRASSKRSRWQLIGRVALGICVLLLGLWVWSLAGLGALMWRPGLWWGALAWLGFQAIVIIGHLLLFGPYSLSSVRSGATGFGVMVVWPAAVLSLVILCAWLAIIWSGVGRRWMRLCSILQGFGLCVLGASVLGFGVTGWGQVDRLPHGLLFFGAIAMHIHSAIWAGSAILLGVWWPGSMSTPGVRR